MQMNLAGQNRYKLISRLKEQEGYQAFAALDIEDSQREEVLLNLYSGMDAPRQMVPLFYGLTRTMCDDFRNSLTQDGGFLTVFRLYHGEDFSSFFHKRSGLEYEERLHYAESLFHLALECVLLPEYLQSQAIREENLVVQKENRRICLNFQLPPNCEDLPSVLRLSPLAEKILLRPWYATNEQIDFLDRLQEGAFESISALYSAWRELEAVASADRKKKKDVINKIFRFIKRSVKRYIKARKARRLEKRRAENDEIEE